jgi:hypothetical protein
MAAAGCNHLGADPLISIADLKNCYSEPHWVRSGCRIKGDKRREAAKADDDRKPR